MSALTAISVGTAAYGAYSKYKNAKDAGGGQMMDPGVIEAPEKLKDDLSISLAQNPWEGVNSYWRILPAPYIMGFVRTINHPQWLVDIITNSVDESGYEIHFAENLGADQMSFAHEGIVSTSIGITCDRPHTPYDNLDLINKASLQKAGEISVLSVAPSPSKSHSYLVTSPVVVFVN